MNNTDHSRYMARALQLARNGALHASPNPMVGAVITAPDGRIIGEGWHRRCGDPHAEVNAVSSVSHADRPLLGDATMYVTLEPCCHWGKTPPCCNLIIENGIRHLVVATVDPFARVAGRGLQMLRDAGIDVTVGVMEREARELNRRFFTAHEQRRPFVTLKWAQSADGFIDGRASKDSPAALLSTPADSAAVHRLRALHDAIAVGSGTFIADNPQLTVRHFAGNSPQRYIFDRRGLVIQPEGWKRPTATTLKGSLEEMYADGVTSLLAEGGRRLLQSFIDEGLWDEIRVETATEIHLGDMPKKVAAPVIPPGASATLITTDKHPITLYRK